MSAVQSARPLIHDPRRFASLCARAQRVKCTLSWVPPSPEGGGSVYVLHDPGHGRHHARVELDDVVPLLVALERTARCPHHTQTTPSPAP